MATRTNDNGKSNTKRKILTKKRVAIIITGLVLLLIARSFINRNTITTEVVKAEKGSITESISASGEVAASDLAVLTFQTPGKLEKLNVKEGDWVQKGQLIARLDTASLYQSLIQAEANLRSAQATLDRTYDNVQGHDDNESFAQRELRTAAEAAKDVAYRNVVQARIALDNARIVAPFAGLLTDMTDGVYSGVNVAPSTVTFTIVDPASLHFKARVNEVDVVKLTKGQRVLLKLDAYPDEQSEQFIKDIAFSSVMTTTGGTAYPITINLPSTDTNKYRLGMNGDANFILSAKENVLLVPSTAIIEENDKEYVWLVENSVTIKKEVKTGSSTIEMIEIKEGVVEGQEVIARPPREIKEGMKIRKGQIILQTGRI